LQKSATEAMPSAAVTLSRSQPQGVPRAVVDAVLGADVAKLPAVVGVELGEQGYVVARIAKVLPREPAPGGDAPLISQYTQAWASAEAQSYLEALKKRFKVEVKESVVATAASAPSP
jgi:peptidyl-prolyl cis-trans isomerase D